MIPLSPDEVHVWHAELNDAEADAAAWLPLLDEDEQARASRLRMPQDRAQFILAHGAARKLIGHYLGCPPADIRFGRAANGKPYLRRADRAPDLRFNASRTKGCAVFAFALGREVGVDIERASGHAEVSALFARILTPAERHRIEAIATETAREQAFYDLWTRKEAILKLRGDGLRIAPSTIDTTQSSPDWRMESIDAVPGCAAAIAVEGTGWRLAATRACSLRDPLYCE